MILSMVILSLSVLTISKPINVYGLPPKNQQDPIPRRILKEIKQLASDPVPGISANSRDEDVRHFDVSIVGPKDSPYEGGIFKLDLILPQDYPDKAPRVKFITKIYHPNINSSGDICLDTIKGSWTPALQIRHVLLSIQALLSEPNPDDPLVGEIGRLWKSNKAEAHANARDWTQKYADKAV